MIAVVNGVFLKTHRDIGQAKVHILIFLYTLFLNLCHYVFQKKIPP